MAFSIYYQEWITFLCPSIDSINFFVASEPKMESELIDGEIKISFVFSILGPFKKLSAHVTILAPLLCLPSTWPIEIWSKYAYRILMTHSILMFMITISLVTQLLFNRRIHKLILVCLWYVWSVWSLKLEKNWACIWPNKKWGKYVYRILMTNYCNSLHI